MKETIKLPVGDVQIISSENMPEDSAVLLGSSHFDGKLYKRSGVVMVGDKIEKFELIIQLRIVE